MFNQLEKQMSRFIKLTDENFRTEVLETTQPALVMIGADWSGACQMMAPVIEQSTRQCGDQIRLGRLDIEANESIAQEYGLQELPILLFFKNGKLTSHLAGLVPKQQVAEKLIGLLH